jgi:hypothetical protein
VEKECHDIESIVSSYDNTIIFHRWMATWIDFLLLIVIIATSGRFAGFRGPGVLIKVSGSTDQWHRIAVGDRGEVLAASVIRIGGANLPLDDQSVAAPAELVRVVGFTESAVQARRDEVQARTFNCEKCGHQNVVS